MPRQRIRYNRTTFDFPVDFPERLKHFQMETGVSWAELARRIGTYPRALWRWRNMGVRPSAEHTIALLDVAAELSLLELLLTYYGGTGRTRNGVPSAAGNSPVGIGMS